MEGQYAIVSLAGSQNLCQTTKSSLAPYRTALIHPAVTSFPADDDKDAHHDREPYEALIRTTQGHGTRQDLLPKV